MPSRSSQCPWHLASDAGVVRSSSGSLGRVVEAGAEEGREAAEALGADGGEEHKYLEEQEHGEERSDEGGA